MRNFWIVARNEYRLMVTKKSFLLGVVGLPLMIIAIMALSITVTLSDQDRRPLGYVDHAGFISTLEIQEDSIAIQGYVDEATAQAALEQGEIQAYYVLPKDYLENRQTKLFYWEKEPGTNAQEDFSSFIKSNLVSALPANVQERLVGGSVVRVRSVDGSREMGDKNVAGFLLPFIASFLFVMVVMTSAGYLLQVVTSEKENRTIEILLTSLSPEQLIGGKVVGLMAVALTQLVTWMITVVLGFMVASRFVDWLGVVKVPWDFLGVIVLFFIPAYALIAGMMTAIGGSTNELRQGQQVAGILNLLFLIPLFLVAELLHNPSGPIVLLLSFFPTTSFLTISMRWALDIVPLWQILTSWLILVTSAILSIWASAPIFRAGMLRYGQKLTLAGMIKAVRRVEAG